MTITVPPLVVHRPTSAPPGVTGGLTAPATGSILLAGEHCAAAACYLTAGAVGLVWIAPELALGAYPSPHVAAVTHCFTLGWLTMTIFGALCQFLPVALGVPLRSRRLAHTSFWIFAPGIGLFAAGVATSSVPLSNTGIALVGVGVSLAIGNIAASLSRARTRDVTWAAMVLALTFLTSTFVFGALLLHNLHTGFIAEARVRALAAHLHVAIVGWVLIMIVGVSHRLLPVFLLAHGTDTRWTRRSLTLLAAGVPALATGVVLGVAPIAWAGLVLLEGGVGCFLWQARAFYRARVRKQIDVGMHFAGTALGFLAVSALLAPAVLVAGRAHARLATAYVVVGLLGGMVLYVTGFFYKIVPLLAWTARYGGRMGQGSVPTIAQLFSTRVAHVQLALMAAAIGLLATGIAVAAPHVVRCGTVLFLAGTVLFAGQLTHIAFGGQP